MPIKGSPMFVVSQKLKALKHRLREFSSTIFLPEMRAALALEKELADIQLRLLSNNALPNDQDLEAELFSKVLKAKNWEESMARQKSRVCWMLQGDSNTAFFHSKAKVRRNINTIRKIRDANGTWHDNHLGITKAILDFILPCWGL